MARKSKSVLTLESPMDTLMEVLMEAPTEVLMEVPMEFQKEVQMEIQMEIQMGILKPCLSLPLMILVTTRMPSTYHPFPTILLINRCRMATLVEFHSNNFCRSGGTGADDIARIDELRRLSGKHRNDCAFWVSQGFVCSAGKKTVAFGGATAILAIFGVIVSAGLV